MRKRDEKMESKASQSSQPDRSNKIMKAIEGQTIVIPHKTHEVRKIEVSDNEDTEAITDDAQPVPQPLSRYY